ncbi:MAG: hypothetical protein HZA61_03960 [Candidatus Eisenbacteria bacterium]|uniref:Zf-HC2 domain-containing protein n=1 Tax=Eiseniibacteriota bacterium TaxID=2212470 RepID=A0A933SEQ0_UNCEI|nr:hypothetical protein [Candidatus Eisenbacteria bacterium]
MNCELFARLLNETGGDHLPEEAFRHAAHCARCTQAFAAARSRERMLASEGGASAPGDRFTDTIMARVAATPQVRVAPVAVPRSTWRDVVNVPVLAAAASGAALLTLAASVGFDPARIAELLTPGRAFQWTMPALALSGPAAQYTWWAVAGSLAAIAIVAGWLVGSLWGEDGLRGR